MCNDIFLLDFSRNAWNVNGRAGIVHVVIRVSTDPRKPLKSHKTVPYNPGLSPVSWIDPWNLSLERLPIYELTLFFCYICNYPAGGTMN